mmetsp:Transcript_116857/g.202802  ORF Transcript_116857/g.202802 Transcript_116857/m.202802 type:complete len:220 (-) Transcript_116857:15-674(-)
MNSEVSSVGASFLLRLLATCATLSSTYRDKQSARSEPVWRSRSSSLTTDSTCCCNRRRTADTSAAKVCDAVPTSATRRCSASTRAAHSARTSSRISLKPAVTSFCSFPAACICCSAEPSMRRRRDASDELRASSSAPRADLSWAKFVSTCRRSADTSPCMRRSAASRSPWALAAISCTLMLLSWSPTATSWLMAACFAATSVRSTPSLVSSTSNRCITS